MQAVGYEKIKVKEIVDILMVGDVSWWRNVGGQCYVHGVVVLRVLLSAGFAVMRTRISELRLACTSNAVKGAGAHGLVLC